jgi:hypothetical protein
VDAGAADVQPGDVEGDFVTALGQFRASLKESLEFIERGMEHT